MDITITSLQDICLQHIINYPHLYKLLPHTIQTKLYKLLFADNFLHINWCNRVSENQQDRIINCGWYIINKPYPYGSFYRNATRLPGDLIHYYAPGDSPLACQRFNFYNLAIEDYEEAERNGTDSSQVQHVDIIMSNLKKNQYTSRCHRYIGKWLNNKTNYFDNLYNPKNKTLSNYLIKKNICGDYLICNNCYTLHIAYITYRPELNKVFDFMEDLYLGLYISREARDISIQPQCHYCIRENDGEITRNKLIPLSLFELLHQENKIQ